MRVEKRYLKKHPVAGAAASAADDKVNGQKRRMDGTLLILVLLLVVCGLIFLYSTSAYNGRVKFHDPAYYFKKQLFATSLGMMGMYLVSCMDYHILTRMAPFLYVVSMGLSLAVLLFGDEYNGSKRWLSIGPLSFQPSEFVKIIFVFFVACRLYRKRATFQDHVITTAVAAAYVLVLVISKDLGSALVFFITYVVMLYVATKKPLYLLAGLGSGCVAAVGAYFLFGHVRQRVVAWKNPFSVYEGAGYQIVQGLFAIGTGSLFGMGLCQGSPNMIPFVKQDYMFAAICEEMGVLFAMCLILICMSMFLLVVNISLQIKKPFYKLIALGLGTEYAFQVFLTIGGVTKFIPMTGITLPLVSYGGSSVLSTIIMLAIIQGLYILREDEDEELEKQKEKRREASLKGREGVREKRIKG